jgi:hypothetical protein
MAGTQKTHMASRSSGKKQITAVSARRAAALAMERALLSMDEKKDSGEEEEELGAFVRANAIARAEYAGALPRPLPCRDSDDDAVAAEREDAFEAHDAARERERALVRAALRRLRVTYARLALVRLHALRREAFALTRLNERLVADAARVFGARGDPRAYGYRVALEPRGDLQTQYDYDLWEDGAPGLSDILRAADAQLLDAERLVANTSPPPPLPFEDQIEDDAETSMSEADEA